MLENLVPKVRVELTQGHPYRFLSSTLVVLPCHTTSHLVASRSYHGWSVSKAVPSSTTLLRGFGRQNVGNSNVVRLPRPQPIASDYAIRFGKSES